MSKKLSLSQKLFLSNMLFAVPIVLLMYPMIASKTKDLSFATQEMVGDAFQKPVMTLLLKISRHKFLSQRALHGDPSSKASLPASESDVDVAMNAVGAAEKQYGAALQFTDEALAKRKRDEFRYSKISQQWKDLRSRLMTLKPTESNDLHTGIITNIRGMITHAGDLSNLILDPDLDSYYLMDITLSALPQAIDRIQDVLTIGEGLLRRGKLTQDEKTQLAIFAALLKQSDADRIDGDVQTALNEDANFNGVSESLQRVLPPLRSETSAAYLDLITLIQKISSGETVPIESFLASGDKLLTVLDKFSSSGITELDVLLTKRTDLIKGDLRLALFSGFGVLLLSLGISLFIARKLRSGFSLISEGLSKSVTRVATTSGSLSDASRQVSSGTTSAASSLEETASAVEELSSMVKQNADNARQAATLAQVSSSSAEKGEAEIQNLIGSMTEISQGSKKIEEIINVIDDIAFQTNLLALNAAVEAARAGEQGKGFAVVAEAVRNLAQRSAAAAKDITHLIQDSVQKIDKGTKVADSSGHVLKDIVSSIRKVSDLNNEIASACAEQANGITQISQAMSQLDTATQQNATASSAVASSAQEMLNEASSLQELVESLNKIVKGEAVNTGQSGMEEPAFHGEDQNHDKIKFPSSLQYGQKRSDRPSHQNQHPALVVNNSGSKGQSNYAKKTIPFDDVNHSSNGKVGTTDGF